MKRKKLIIFISILLILSRVIYVSFRTIFKKSYRAEDFQIEVYKSRIDKDNDGIDDQTDILENVKEYIASKPKYKSKYYASGYPDDEYGVCTDVVAFGLLKAGYDLKELVYQDVINHRDNYDIEVVDKNIDFRRVKNLQVYFKNNSISLTLDTFDIGNWQGGDIVVFKNHVGIVSDKRNKRGVPYLIHHYSTHQFSYEEDILENRDDIVGHYRIS